jgi:dihydrodipicolinate synthase/N-acetylneuraminate lyase
VRERDLDVLRQLSGNATAFRDRIDDYEQVSRQLLLAIQEAIDKKDATALGGDSRSLVGVSAQVGAHRVTAESEAIESAAAKGDFATARALFHTLVPAHEAALEKLLSIRASGFP